MKKAITLFSILLLSLCACQNDGHIGSLYGTWSLTQMTVNGEQPSDFVKDKTTWSFQSDIVRIVYDLGPSDYDDRLSTWVQTTTDGHKYLDFKYTYGENDVEPGMGAYRAPEWLGWPTNRTIRLEYIKDSSREMVLTWMSDAGDNYVYTLKKTW